MPKSLGFDSISVVMPAYRLGDQIAENVAAVGAALPGARIIVVDDGSDDTTFEQAETASAEDSRVRVGAVKLIADGSIVGPGRLATYWQ